MKKQILVVAFLAMATATVQAQGFRAGIKAGANMTQVTGKSFKEEFDLGYQAGIFTEIDFNKKWGIQPEVLWSQSATKRSTGFNTIYNNILNPAADQNIKLNYLSIPVLVRYNVGKLVSLNVGPQFGILIDQDKNFLQNGEKAFKEGDFSMLAGLQLNLKTLRIYGRYNIGLTNLNDIDEQEKWKSQQIQLGLGLRF
jgi:hypothetical protein